MKKAISVVSFFAVAFLVSAASASYAHGFSETASALADDDAQPVQMTCTVLAAWTSSGAPVDPSLVRLTGAADLKIVTVGSPCASGGSNCAPAEDITTGAPLQAWGSGC